jgi:hypothetical protein
MLVKLKHPLKSKPEPIAKPLKSYMAPASRCATIGGNPDRDELVAILRDSPKLDWHVCKRKVRRRR